MTRTLLASLLSLLISSAFAQDRLIDNFSSNVNPAALSAKSKQTTHTRNYRLIQVDLNQLQAELENAPHCDGLTSRVETQIALPLSESGGKLYRII